MIVKNESEIIELTLKNILDKIKIDYYVISDTGSSDNTKDIIQNFFDKNNVKGELFDDEWKNFAHNRTKALEHAFGKTDFLLVFDADDEIYGNLILPENLEFDCYNLIMKCGSAIYERPMILNNKKKWKYESVIHEYLLGLDNNTKSKLQGDYYIIGKTNGARSKNPYKYLFDALTLEKAFYEVVKTPNEHLQPRYAFYCANSYFDYGHHEKSIEWYKKRLELGSWCQEKYYSCKRLSEAYEILKDKQKSLYYLVKTYNYDKERVEGIYQLIKHYTVEDENEIAYNYYNFIKNHYEENCLTYDYSNKLFLDISIHYFYLPYYMIILSERVKKYETGIKMYEIIFKKKFKDVSEWWVKNLMFNIRFFLDKTEDSNFYSSLKEYLNFLSSDYKVINWNFNYLEKYIN
jgi:glycosyltransferase involved in cell wall biosynthesis